MASRTTVVSQQQQQLLRSNNHHQRRFERRLGRMLLRWAPLVGFLGLAISLVTYRAPDLSVFVPEQPAEEAFRPPTNVLASKGSLPPSEQRFHEANHTEVVVEDAVLKTTQTDPPFRIWLYPPRKDIISRRIARHGIYEPEDVEFSRLVASAVLTNNSTTAWAVDIGANLGFHALHLAALGFSVVAFEPAADTASLLHRSIGANEGFRHRVRLVRAAAGESPGWGSLVRHEQSAGMTMLRRDDDEASSTKDLTSPPNNTSSSLPFGVQDVVGTRIEIVRPRDVLEATVGATEPIALLKVDAEGHELHALQGTDLTRHPAEFLALEFFPELLREAGRTDPRDLLGFLASSGYACATTPSAVFGTKANTAAATMATPADYEAWYDSHAGPSHQRDPKYHENLYCRRRGHRPPGGGA